MLIHWRTYHFDELTPSQLYSALALRQAVFVVEQNCSFQDADGFDRSAVHILGCMERDDCDTVAATLRVLPPFVKYDEPSIGRICTDISVRGTGLGHDLLRRGILYCRAQYPGSAVRIAAQSRLQRFYEGHGFVRCGEEYVEDGIPHVEMLLP